MEYAVTREDLGREGFILYQNKEGFRFGTDSVLLAWFTASLVPRKGKVRILELGSGCGGAAMCLAARLAELKTDYSMDLAEIDPVSCEILKRNILENGLAGRVNAYCCDIRDMPDEIRKTQYDIVFANPPYYPQGSGEESRDPRRNTARIATDTTYDDFARAASSRLIPSTGMYMVVIDGAFSGKMMDSYRNAGINIARIAPCYPGRNGNARLVLLAGRRRDNEDTKILSPIFLDDKEEMKRIYEEEHQDCFI